jgi:hypothetical protein
MTAKERKSMLRKPARIAVALALTLGLGGAGAVASSAPAFAVSPGCSFQQHWSVTSTAVTAYFYYVCTDPPANNPVAFSLYKNDTVVATGSGAEQYLCNGSTENQFSMNMGDAIEAACG